MKSRKPNFGFKHFIYGQTDDITLSSSSSIEGLLLTKYILNAYFTVTQRRYAHTGT